MSFVCPQCSGNDSLAILKAIELPPDSRSDEIALQVVACPKCGFEGLAVYQESRRGALDSESWEHTGYRVAREDLEAARNLIRICPDPSNVRCQCVAHQALGKTGDSGVWNIPAKYEIIEAFRISRSE